MEEEGEPSSDSRRGERMEDTSDQHQDPPTGREALADGEMEGPEAPEPPESAESSDEQALSARSSSPLELSDTTIYEP